MKKMLALAAVCGTMLAGCSGNGKNNTADSDSTARPEIADSITSAAAPVAYLRNDSIGAIYVGMDINEIPDSVAGLYNRKEQGASPDAVTVTFSNAGEESFIAYDFGEGKVDVLNVIGKDVKIKAPRGEFGMGDNFSKVLELPGVTEEWAGYDGNGMWYWVCDGIWFAPSQENLSDMLAKRIYHSGDAPTRADFDGTETIGFIGTGLPF